MNAKVAAAEVLRSFRRARAAAQIGGLSNQELLDLLREAPIITESLVKTVAQRKQYREQLVTRRDAAPAQAARELKARLEAREATREALEKAEAARLTAQTAAAQAQALFYSADCQLRNVTSGLDMLLEETAPAEIAEFITRLTREFDEARSEPLLPLHFSSRFETVDDTQFRERAAYLTGLREATAAARLLKITAIDGEELLAELARLEAAIPHRDAYAPRSSRPLPGSLGRNGAAVANS